MVSFFTCYARPRRAEQAKLHQRKTPTMSAERDKGINSGYQGHATLTLGSTLWRTRVRHEKAAKTRFQEAHISQPARMRQEISSTDYDAAVRARDELRYQLLEKQRDAMQRSMRAGSPPRKVDRPAGMGGDICA